jgi:hypothetical protein
LEEVAGDSFISTTPSETGIAFGGKVLQVSHYLPAAGENRGLMLTAIMSMLLGKRGLDR